MKLTKKLWGILTLLALWLLLPAPVHAQYSPIQGWCEDGNEAVVTSGLDSTNPVQASHPLCTVTVVIHGAGSATIYSTSTGTPLANPFTAEANGQFLFYIDPADSYDVTLTGGTPALPAPVVILTDYSPGGGGSTPTNAALKPAIADGIVFVAPEGSDSNDCLSWGSACLTIKAAYNKLSSIGGTVYITSGRAAGTGPACTTTTGRGLGIAGVNDPNYASMPETLGTIEWVKMKSGAVSFIGASATSANGHFTVGTTPIVCGGTSSAFTFSDVNGITLSYLEMQYPTIGVSVGVDSNGLKTGAVINTSNIILDNLTINVGTGSSTLGPDILIGGNTYWVRVSDSTLIANSNASADADHQSAVLIDPDGGKGSVAINIERTHINGGGGIRFDATSTTTTSGISVINLIEEGAAITQPMYEIVDPLGGASVNTYLENLQTADPGDTPPAVVIPIGYEIQRTVINRATGDGMSVYGPAVIIGGAAFEYDHGVSLVGTKAFPTVAPEVFNQRGSESGRLLDQADTMRKNFPPTLARFTNLAAQLPASWTTFGTAAVTTGRTAPDGTTNAAKVTTSASSSGARAYNSNATLVAGDYIYAGVWTKMASTGGPTKGNQILTLQWASAVLLPLNVTNPASHAGLGGDVVDAQPYLQTDGDWQWIWALAQVTESGTHLLRASLQAYQSYPMDFYAPLLVVIPAADVAITPAPTFTGATETGHIVTMTTSGAHLLTAGEPLMIASCSISGYNGKQTISATPTTSSFTYYVSGTGLGVPTSCVITTLNDSEVSTWALSANTYSDNAPARTLAGPRGTPLSFAAASNNFWGTLSHANTANRTYTFPDADATVVGTSTTQNLSNKTLLDTTTTIANTSDVTKTLKFDLSGATASAQALLSFIQTSGRTYTFPDRTGTVCVSLGTCSVTQLTSTIATGTAPLVVTSTTPVANLAATPTTYGHTATQLTNAHIIVDSCILGTDCAVTLTGAAVFTSSTSYTCVAQDQTAAAATKVAQASGSGFTITGTGTDSIRYTCIGD